MAMNFLQGAESALIGELPINQDDWNVIRGLYRSFDIDADPSLGYAYAPRPPVGYVHESEQAGIITGMCVVMVLIIIPTAARIFLKARSRETLLGWDDYTIVMAAISDSLKILALVYPTLVIVMCATAGGGHHTWENTYADYQRFFYYLAVCKLIFYVAVGMIKVSITLFVRRLADGASRVWQIVANSFLVTVIGFIVASLFWNLFLCSPSRTIWDKWYEGTLEEPPQCGDVNLNSRVLGIIHSTQGVLLLLAPIVILWRVRINLAKKIRLFVIWAAGAVTVTFGLLQLVPTNASTDIFWVFTRVLRWTTLDLAMGIVTASLPVLDTALVDVWHAATTMPNRSRPDADGVNSPSWANADFLSNVSAGRNTTSRDGSESVERMIKSRDNFSMKTIRTDKVRADHNP